MVASRVGTDALGDEVVRELVRRGMATDFVQRDARHPTSTVNVTLEAGQPTFTFTPDIAWDHLEFTPEWAELAATVRCGLLWHARAAVAPVAAAIWKFLDAAPQAIRLFDVNLRQGFYDRESIRRRLPAGDAREAQRAGVAGRRRACRIVGRLRTHGSAGGAASSVWHWKRRSSRGASGVRCWCSPTEIVDPPPVSYPAAPDADAVGPAMLARRACSSVGCSGCRRRGWRSWPTTWGRSSRRSRARRRAAAHSDDLGLSPADRGDAVD